MLGLLIGIAITAIAARLIIKNYQPQTVLLVAGLVLLGLTALLFPDQSILYQKTKSMGWKGFDIFAFVKESLATQISGIGLIIMASAAFAMVPAGVMLVVAQRYIATGLTAGSVVG